MYPGDLLVDCENWQVSASWAVPSTAVSGVYVAKLERTDAGHVGQSNHIVFVVRNDSSTSDIVFQTSDTTWQAYNSYGGVSLYGGVSATQVPRVSYNRPVNNRFGNGLTGSATSQFFNSEYPMIRWLEANGYDVTYIAGVDTDRYSGALLTHKAFLSVGHDEYWSANQRANVEAARAAHVNLAFFSGNEVTWKTHLDASISGTPNRTLVCFKETQPSVYSPSSASTGNFAQDMTTQRIYAGARSPNVFAPWTGQWRDPTRGPSAGGGRPENALTGQLWTVQLDFRSLEVPPLFQPLRLWRNISLGPSSATLGDMCTCHPGSPCGCILGLEWNEDPDNGSRPPGLVRASSTYAPPGYFSYIVDWGSQSQSPHEATHRLTYYRYPPTAGGTLVFAAGTINWSWGLDREHDFDLQWGPYVQWAADVRVQQATVNLFGDMCNTSGNCILPRTIQPGLVNGVASTDSIAPTSAVTFPANNSLVYVGTQTTVVGTAVDMGGGVVGGVEVSVDGGSTWHPADIDSRNPSLKTCTWKYTWMPTSLGGATIRSRAVDDSGILGSAGPIINVTVNPRPTQPLLFYKTVVTSGVRSGSSAFGVLDNLGNYTNVGTATLAPDWDNIVGVKGNPMAGSSGYDNALLFYRKSDGLTWVSQLNDNGSYSEPFPVNPPNYLPGPGWTHVVAGSGDTILFYDNTGSGRVMIARLDKFGAFAPLSAFDMPGSPTPVYTKVVATENNVFLFYNDTSGTAATVRLNDPASPFPTWQPVTGLAAGWTHIVAGVNNVLLFFRSSPGNAMSTRLNSNGTLTTLQNPLWSSGVAWTSVIAGFYNKTILLYHHPTGTIATGTLDENGVFASFGSGSGFSTGWATIASP